MSPFSQKRFLLVEKDESSRQVLKGYLSSLGCNDFYEAKTIGEAIELINTWDIDCILSEWNMPGATGFSLLKLIKLQERFKNVVFILMSGIEGQENRRIQSAVKYRVDGFLLKPFEAQKLSDLLQKIYSRVTT